MNKLQLKLAKWLFKRMGYKFVAIKQVPIPKHNVYTEVPTLFIEGDKELLMYVDTSGFLTKKEPLRRVYNVEKETAVHKLPAEVVAEITLNTKPFPEKLQKENEKID